MNGLDHQVIVRDEKGNQVGLFLPIDHVAGPLCLGRHLDVPAVAKPRLLLRVATEGKGPSELSVYVEGTRIWQQACSCAKTGDGWKDWQLDLSAYKGKRVWVVVRHHPREWKRAIPTGRRSR